MVSFKKKYFYFLALWSVCFQACGQGFVIKHFDIDLTVRANGALNIKETIDVFFTEAKHGIYKDIPTRYNIEFQAGLESATYKLLHNNMLVMPIRNIRVQPATYLLEPEENYLRIKIGDENKKVEGSQRYVIEYEVDNIAAYYSDHVEINWNLIGDQWNARIEKATYTVHLPQPQSTYNPVLFATFTGASGSTSNASQSQWVDNQTLKGAMTQHLELNQAWTLNLRFPKDNIRYEAGDVSFLAKKFFLKHYDTHYTIQKDGSTEVTIKADLKFVNTVNSLWIPIDNFVAERAFGMSGRWLHNHTYYTIENVRWQGAVQDKEEPFKIHFNDVKAGEERRVELRYTLKGNVADDAQNAGYSRVFFRHKNYFLNEPILASKTLITLPVSAVEAMWLANESSDFNSEWLTSRTDGHNIIIESTKPISSDDYFYQPTVSVPSGALAFSSGVAWKRGWTNNQWIFYSLLPLIFVFWFWHKKGRDKPITIVPQYYPPPNMTPAEAGVLIDDKLHDHDIISLIPYWASQGLIKIEEIETVVLLGLLKNTDYKLTRLNSLPETATSYEKRLFDGLFSGQNSVLLSSLRLTFYKTMEKVTELLKYKIEANRHYEGSGIDAGKAMKIGGYVLFGLCVLFTFSFEGIPEIGFVSVETGAGALVLGLVMVVLSRKMPKKSLLGVEMYRQLAGYRMFMQTVELPRLQQLIREDPHYFDKTLPYAMVFNLTDNWSQKFEVLNVPPPSWYSSNVNGFTTSQFARRFQDASQTMSNTLTSAPSKSGSSGSGGSSGGGFGGGGGGSW